MSTLPCLDAHVNDSLEEINHQHPTIRVERNHDEIFTIVASNEVIPPVPTLKTTVESKSNTTKKTLQNLSLHACEMVDKSSNWIGNQGFWGFELACEDCGKSADDCLKRHDVVHVCKHCRKGECNKTRCALHCEIPPRKSKNIAFFCSVTRTFITSTIASIFIIKTN